MNTNNFNADSLLNSAFSNMKLVDVANADAVATLLDRFGLRWEVSKQPLVLPTGEDTGFFGIVREDNKKTFATGQHNMCSSHVRHDIHGVQMQCESSAWPTCRHIFVACAQLSRAANMLG